jgi:type III secretion protein O
MTIVQELLRLKVHREHKAEMAVSVCRQTLAEANRNRDKAREALADYRQWSVAEETNWYGRICRQVVRVGQIHQLLEDVAALRTKERELDATLEDSEQARQHSETELLAARDGHRQASRAREKFVRLAEAQSEELRLESERKEDAETEDLYALRKEREDWGDSGDA